MKNALLLTIAGLLGLAAGPVAAQVSPWTEVPTPAPASSFSWTRFLQLPASQTVWAVRYNNMGMGSGITTVLATSNDGLTWQQAATQRSVRAGFPSSGSDVLDLSAVDGQRAWLIRIVYPGGSKQVEKTTTGPTGFAPVTQVNAEPQFVRFMNATTGLLVAEPVGGSNTLLLFRTTDAGQSWQPVTNLPASITGMQALVCTTLGSNFWLSTQQGAVLHSPDAGLTWTVGTAPQPLSKMAFHNGQQGIAYGNGPNRPQLQTRDGGRTWMTIAPTGPRRHTGLAVVPGTNNGVYFCVGLLSATGFDTPGSSISFDFGLTWQELDNVSGRDDIASSPGGQVWASEYGSGRLLRFTGGFPLSKRDASQSALALYPNPTTGRVQLPAAGEHRRVRVYDAAGRLCQTAELGAASNSLDLSGQGAGLYLVWLDGGTAAPQQQRLVVTP